MLQRYGASAAAPGPARPIDAFLLVTGSSGPSLRCLDT
jgi:hypothetical protein